MIDQFDPWAIKDELTSLECEPVNRWHLQVAETENWSEGSGSSKGASQTKGTSTTTTEGRNHTWSRHSGTSETRGESESSGFSSGMSESAGMGETILPDGSVLPSVSESAGATSGNFSGKTTSRNRTDSVIEGASEGTSTTDSFGSNQSEATQESKNQSQSKGGSRTRTWVRITDLIKRRVVSSRTFLSLDEFLILQTQKIQALPQAHFVIKTAGAPALIVRGPWVKTPVIGKNRLKKGLDRVYELPYYTDPALIAGEEEQRTIKLLAGGDHEEFEEENEVLD